MGGVVTGTAMAEVAKGQKWLAVFINEQCNMDCLTCYLGAKQSERVMSTEVAKNLCILASKQDGVAIIGTEPLLDQRSIDLLNIFSKQHRTHIITNGKNLAKYADQITQVKRIDVSLDGGPRSYPRGASFAKICEGAQRWKNLSGGEVCALNILYGENIGNIDDMLVGGKQLGADEIFFSPYVRTLGARVLMSPLSMEKIVQALLPFVGSEWKLMVDPYHAIFEWRDWAVIKEISQRLPEKNLLLIDFDPGDRVRRIEIDGSEKHPFMALHPGIKLSGKKLV